MITDGKSKDDVRGPERAGELTTQAADGRHGRSGGILHDFLKGLLFIALALVIKLAAEQTTLGKRLHLMSYDLLQLRLSAEDMPVTIVDISDLEPQDFNINGQTGRATPREPLRKMLVAITEHEPAAIGVDIDFSPNEGGYIQPDDPEFFQFCLDLQKKRGVPIFLGIRRTMSKPSAEWLGSEKYQELAANILIPKDRRRMLSAARIESGQTQGSSLSKSMSVVLADAYGQRPADSPSWFRQTVESLLDSLRSFGFVEKISEKNLGPGLTVEDFLVDFSSLESIEPLRTINPTVLRDQSQRQRFHGKVVLIGDASPNKAADVFDVPAREQNFSGVFLHACAVYTLIKGPLYEVTSKGRLAIDIVFLLSILLAITLIRLYFKNRASEEVATRRLQGLLTVIVVAAALLVGIVFIRITRVMWDDFFLALLALVFHPSIERHLENLWEFTAKHTPGLFKRLAFKRNGEVPK